MAEVLIKAFLLKVAACARIACFYFSEYVAPVVRCKVDTLPKAIPEFSKMTKEDLT